MIETDWANVFKIRVRELTEAQTKHLIVKALIVQKILMKHRKDKHFIRVYTEFAIKPGKICDVYYENLKTKEAIAYEIQSDVSKEWLKETKKAYDKWDPYHIKNHDWILVDLNKLSEVIEDLNEEIKEIVI